MNRLLIIGAILCATFLVTSPKVMAEPAGPPTGLDVNVLNTPLPVTGEMTGTISGHVEVTNDEQNPVPVIGEMTGTISGQVEVTNDEQNPVPVKVLDNQTIVEKSGAFSEASPNNFDIYTVPQDQLLVIEYVSFSVSGSQPMTVYEMSIMTPFDNSFPTYQINIPPVINISTTYNNLAYCNGGQVTKIYALPGTVVRGVKGVQGIGSPGTSSYAGFMTISGHLIPYE